MLGYDYKHSCRRECPSLSRDIKEPIGFVGEKIIQLIYTDGNSSGGNLGTNVETEQVCMFLAATLVLVSFCGACKVSLTVPYHGPSETSLVICAIS